MEIPGIMSLFYYFTEYLKASSDSSSGRHRSNTDYTDCKSSFTFGSKYLFIASVQLCYEYVQNLSTVN